MEIIRKDKDGSYEIELEETLTISFKIEEELLEQVDKAVKEFGYANRSDLIRDAISEFMTYLDNNSGIKLGKK
ncbi:ribbon-helix-helix protein, CopG family [Acidianus sulfidivorans JP7]|uniref:CopG family transcriptional regulator n=1 Tax=Acidianus sulfidivorans JP7 TaxID=619593 RepID=A0A2U9IK39_9CREN|nr:ribbon-helix-helix domain-containing protein [Acidianus sulfidivorans]AWR96407.1 ribbon-helix-helix protein, CopG family [Acidianus sulfidivorans JP7]